MIFTHRPMQPEDVPECVKIMAAHPVFGPRYGREIEILPKAWLRLLQSEAQITAVIRAGDGPRGPIVGAGVTSIVRAMDYEKFNRNAIQLALSVLLVIELARIIWTVITH